MTQTIRDENRVAGLIAKSDANDAVVVVEADPTTKRLKVNATITGSIGGGGSTSTTTQVGDSTSVQTLKAANENRIKVVVVNTSSAILYVKEGSTATSSDWSYRLEQYDTAIIDDYDGIVTGIWSADSGGSANITETT